MSIKQSKGSVQDYERAAILPMPIGLPVEAEDKIPTGRINETILPIDMTIYVDSLEITDRTDVSVRFEYDITITSLGSTNGHVDIDLPATPESIAGQIRVAIAATVFNTWSTVISTNDIIFQTPGYLPTPRSFTNPTRTLNSAFQVSTTRDALVSYTVDIAATLSLVTGQAGTVTLQYADNSGMSTNLVTVQSSVNGNAGTLALGLGLTQTASCSLTGMIPAGKYVRLVTANTVGTPAFTMRAAQEVLL